MKSMSLQNICLHNIFKSICVNKLFDGYEEYCNFIKSNFEDILPSPMIYRLFFAVYNSTFIKYNNNCINHPGCFIVIHLDNILNYIDKSFFVLKPYKKINDVDLFDIVNINNNVDQLYNIDVQSISKRDILLSYIRLFSFYYPDDLLEAFQIKVGNIIEYFKNDNILNRNKIYNILTNMIYDYGLYNEDIYEYKNYIIDDDIDYILERLEYIKREILPYIETKQFCTAINSFTIKKVNSDEELTGLNYCKITSQKNNIHEDCSYYWIEKLIPIVDYKSSGILLDMHTIKNKYAYFLSDIINYYDPGYVYITLKLMNNNIRVLIELIHNIFRIDSSIQFMISNVINFENFTPSNEMTYDLIIDFIMDNIIISVDIDDEMDELVIDDDTESLCKIKFYLIFSTQNINILNLLTFVIKNLDCRIYYDKVIQLKYTKFNDKKMMQLFYIG